MIIAADYLRKRNRRIEAGTAIGTAKLQHAGRGLCSGSGSGQFPENNWWIAVVIS
jgi:hypothetical protein